MSLFRQLARAYIARRLLGPPRGGRSYGRYPGRYGYYGRRRPSRGGFYGPFPYWSARTRRGTHVRVGGCCLPIPLGALALSAGAARLARRR